MKVMKFPPRHNTSIIHGARSRAVLLIRPRKTFSEPTEVSRIFDSGPDREGRIEERPFADVVGFWGKVDVVLKIM
jgi:hypothetical protein